MKNSGVDIKGNGLRRSEQGMKRLRNAIARRRLQEMRDEKVLQSWLAEVWDQSTWSDEFDRSGRFH